MSMFAVRKASLASTTMARSSPLASGIGSVRSLLVPYVPVSRKKMFRDPGAKIRKRMRKVRANYRKPTLEEAMDLAKSTQEMDNASLVTLGALGNHHARREILKRHIMSVDRISYDEAEKVYQQIKEKNQEKMFLLALPYQIGIATAVTAGVASLPMVFHFGTASWFNEAFVTTDVPEPADLETLLEIGSWTWNWMEPPLGTVSFVLLALQFSRAQFMNLGVRPYTEKVKLWRGRRLAEAFKQYDADILIKYSQSSSLYDP